MQKRKRYAPSRRAERRRESLHAVGDQMYRNPCVCGGATVCERVSPFEAGVVRAKGKLYRARCVQCGRTGPVSKWAYKAVLEWNRCPHSVKPDPLQTPYLRHCASREEAFQTVEGKLRELNEERVRFRRHTPSNALSYQRTHLSLQTKLWEYLKWLLVSQTS